MDCPPNPLPDLANMFLFQDVHRDSLSDLLDQCEHTALEGGDVLLAPGTRNHNLYLVLAGKLGVHLDDVDNPAVTHLLPGQCVGEMSLIDEQDTSAYVVAAEPSRLLTISRDTLWLLIERSHTLARNLLAILTGRVRQGNELIVRGMEREKILSAHANQDPLTGLQNRRSLMANLAGMVERARQGGGLLSLVMIDVDHFKKYNDTHGHPAGDAALQAVAVTLNSHLRGHDIAARYGGEEFVVLLPDTTVAAARKTAERLREAVAATAIRQEGQPLPGVTASFGLAHLEAPQDGDALLATADAALYRAKLAGRNCVTE